MQVYDFDHTIYDGDSTIDFYLFCLKRNPLLLAYSFRQAYGLLLYALGLLDKTGFKEYFFCFLRGVKQADSEAARFWEYNRRKIYPWYIRQKAEDDIIISASPEFLLNPICKELGVTLIGSVVNPQNGRFQGNNCYGDEKKDRFLALYQNKTVDCFYSDSLCDTPMLQLARTGYIVQKGRLTSWREYETAQCNRSKMCSHLRSAEFIRFILAGCLNAINGIVFASTFSLFLQANIAFALGYLISLSLSYYINSIFTFREKLSVKKYLKFCIGYVPNFIIQNITVGLLYNTLHWSKWVAFIAAAVIGVPVTFLCMKRLRFGSKRGNDQPGPL